MKNIKHMILGCLGLTFLLVACEKIQDLPSYVSGKGSTLTASSASIAPAASDSINYVITFSFTDPEFATPDNNVKYVVEIDSAGKNFSNPLRKTVVGQPYIPFTGKELNDFLLGRGYTLGKVVDMDVRVISSYANNNDPKISNTVRVKMTPINDPSVLTSTQSTVTLALANAAQTSNTFNWTAAFRSYPGAITYTLQYDSAGKNFANPKEIAVGTSIYTKSLTQGEMNETALNSGILPGTTGKVDYRVKAVTPQGTVAFSNAVSVTMQPYQPIIRLYMPGGYQAATGNGNDWDPGTAPEFVRDLRSDVLNRLYYMYIFLPANAEFKITSGRAWDLNYGGTGGTLSQNGSNLKVTTAGVYRISVDLTNMKYDIREGRMGTVGDATAAGWSPSSAFPSLTALGYNSPNLFVGVQNLSVGGWKFIDNNDWDNGSKTVTETRSYGSNGGPGSTLIVNGSNMPNVTTAGRYRLIWDGRNRDNVKYDMMMATEMRVVGDGINGVAAWNPGASPQMTYMGNGKWQITLQLVGGKDIKFLGGNDWGAFDYEDASGGSTAVGTPRKIQYDGGPNFKTPAASGTYTIILDENAQTVTIN